MIDKMAARNIATLAESNIASIFSSFHHYLTTEQHQREVGEYFMCVFLCWGKALVVHNSLYDSGKEDESL